MKKYRTLKVGHLDQTKLRKATEAARRMPKRQLKLTLKLTKAQLKPEDLNGMNVTNLAITVAIHGAKTPHLCAEIAFALACFHRNNKDVERASYWKKQTIILIREWTEKEADTYEACAALCISILGIPIPGLFHEGTIRQGLKDVPDEIKWDDVANR
ncbi:MAG: hypothetical protein Q8R36_04665 [bacterium]|nr:hypothetical protein [bacterium]